MNRISFLILLAFLNIDSFGNDKNSKPIKKEGREITVATVAKDPSSEIEINQASEQNNSLSLEVLGRAVIYSVNYDHRFNEIFGIGFGLSYFKADSGVFMAPVFLTIYPLKRFFITAGALTAPFEKKDNILGTTSLGYEYKNADGFLFRGSLYQFYSSKFTMPAWPGVSVGFAF